MFSRQLITEQLAKTTASIKAAGGADIAAQIADEEHTANLLIALGESADDRQLQLLFSTPRTKASTVQEVIRDMSWITNLLDPAKNDLMQASISPIGLVHLYRQYFFEFDSFLGPSVQHIWMSPGSTLELVEVATRKVTQEREQEEASETTQKTEKSSSSEDELSEAQKQQNSQDTKIGVSLSDTLNIGPAFISNSATLSSSLNYDTTSTKSREQSHRARRNQSEQTSSELKQSFKSTFRTVTEDTDTQSKRYVLANSTNRLLNYELRRKMRQVGVQLQDIGSYLCWQTYVDNPGREIGIADLVHVAQTTDLSQIADPARPPALAEYADPPLTVQWTWKSNGDRWRTGMRVIGTKLLTPQPGFVYSRSEIRIVSGEPWGFGTWPQGDTPEGYSQGVAYQKGQTVPSRLQIPFTTIPAPNEANERNITMIYYGMMIYHPMEDDDDHEFTLEITIYYKPSLQNLADTEAQYQAAVAQATEEKKRAFTDGLFDKARERIKFASNLQPRNFEDLRNEERIVVYRSLVRKLLKVAGVQNPTNEIKHIFSELVEAIFDVDKMLYFVAPEWWQPRPLPEELPQPGTDGSELPPDPAGVPPDAVGLPSSLTAGLARQVGWGGPQSVRPDNYYITEESAPAKMGSSLGWLLQLDGDTPRNAFLNAPWVKAVVPIREGMEFRAIDWLSDPTIEGADGLDAKYATASAQEAEGILQTLRSFSFPTASLNTRYAQLPASGLTILDAIRAIVVRLQQKAAAGREIKADPDALPGETMGALPVDQVFEFGFAPIDGFKAEQTTPFDIYDQWIETVPTDQIVPVEVRYNPATGALLVPDEDEPEPADPQPFSTPIAQAHITVIAIDEAGSDVGESVIGRIRTELPTATVNEDIVIEDEDSPELTEIAYFYVQDANIAAAVAACVQDVTSAGPRLIRKSDVDQLPAIGTIQITIVAQT